jgi:hypothetical protein
MALTNNANKTAPNTGAVAPTGTAPKGKKTAANEEILNQGQEILAAMSEEERNGLGAKAGSLHFVQLLGLASKKSSRRVSATESKDCSTPVGITLVSDEAISVPVIDVAKNKDTGIEQSDISYRDVAAGEQFDVTYYEFMYLILRDEYAGFCEANGDERGAYFSPKLPAFWKGEAKLPTPTVNFKSGSVKSTMLDIDEKGPNGWAVKDQYAEKFGALLKKSTPQRAAGTKSTTPAPTVVAVALQKILGLK